MPPTCVPPAARQPPHHVQQFTCTELLCCTELLRSMALFCSTAAAASRSGAAQLAGTTGHRTPAGTSGPQPCSAQHSGPQQQQQQRTAASQHTRHLWPTGHAGSSGYHHTPPCMRCMYTGCSAAGSRQQAAPPREHSTKLPAVATSTWVGGRAMCSDLARRCCSSAG